MRGGRTVTVVDCSSMLAASPCFRRLWCLEARVSTSLLSPAWVPTLHQQHTRLEQSGLLSPCFGSDVQWERGMLPFPVVLCGMGDRVTALSCWHDRPAQTARKA